MPFDYGESEQLLPSDHHRTRALYATTLYITFGERDLRSLRSFVEFQQASHDNLTSSAIRKRDPLRPVPVVSQKEYGFVKWSMLERYCKSIPLVAVCDLMLSLLRS